MPTRKDRAKLKVVEQAETEVRDKPERRRFTAAYKSRILSELEAAPPGGKAAILRREGLYSSAVHKWRAAADQDDREKRKAGRKKNALTAENRKLRQQNMRLQKQLFKANQVIELQKKVSEILGVTLEELSDDE